MTRFLAILGLLSSPLAAEETVSRFTLPEGCTAYVTLQLRSCQVRHYFRCTGDSEGDQRSVTLDESGLIYLGLIDAETQWLESVFPRSGNAERLVSGSADGASFSSLTSTGLDQYDFRIEHDAVGAIRHIGSDRLTGRSVVIDDVELEETELSYTTFDSDGNKLQDFTGSEFINRAWGRFVPGVVTVTDGVNQRSFDNTPVEFLFPEETGFLSENPKYGCGEALS